MTDLASLSKPTPLIANAKLEGASMPRIYAILLILSATTALAGELLFPNSDFEEGTLNGWVAEGEAFRVQPTRGDNPKARNRESSNLQGNWWVGGYERYTGREGKPGATRGDAPRGSLTSREFVIRHPFITFRIGGGRLPGEVGVRLLAGGEVVDLATGNDSETMTSVAVDVSKHAGKTARLLIFDDSTGGWGHVNVDEFHGVDQRGTIPLAETPEPPPVEVTREVTIDADYLQLPLLDRDKRQQPGVAKFTIEENGRVLRFLRLRFPQAGQSPDFWYSADVREFRGRRVVLRYRSNDAEVLERLTFSDEKIVAPEAYDGPHRPRFHFSPRMGWMNDVNGTHYHNGLYHLFYQANPTMTGVSTGFDMHWGHSVSRDLVHWEEWPIALHPDEVGNIFSGTAMLIRKHVPGINDGQAVPTPALFFSGTSPFSQHVATTGDGGRTWRRYSANPIVKNMGVGDRDPKVFWHEPSEQYVMVLFVGKPRTYRILTSPDLKEWEQQSVLPGWNECPEFLPFTSPTTGEKLWLLYGGYNSEAFEDPPTKFSSAYQLGRFDGRVFTPITPIRRAHQGPNFYAAITFAGEPEERHLMMGWAAGARFPGEPFNGCATLPLRMTLRDYGGKDTLCYQPAKEVDTLRGKPLLRMNDVMGAEANAKLQMLERDALLDVVLTLDDSQTKPVTLSLGRNGFRFDSAKSRLTRLRDGRDSGTLPLHPKGTMVGRFLIDRSLTECFWNHGEAAYAIGALQTDPGPAFEINDEAQIAELVVYSMKNIWE